MSRYTWLLHAKFKTVFKPKKSLKIVIEKSWNIVTEHGWKRCGRLTCIVEEKMATFFKMFASFHFWTNGTRVIHITWCSVKRTDNITGYNFHVRCDLFVSFSEANKSPEFSRVGSIITHVV